MFKSVRVGSLFGIPVRLDITLLLILPVFAWLIGAQIGELVDVLNATVGASIDPNAVSGDYTPWLLGLAAGVGLFVGVLCHEFGHAVVALRYDYGIEAITLWLLGGLAHLVDQPDDWRHELQIAIAGPIVSVLFGVGSYALMLAAPADANAARFILAYLAVLNVALAIFNMLPGFPMDGGRVLRALLARNQPFAKATQQAAEVGKAFAFLLGLAGLFLWDIFMIGIAFFIYIAAASEAQQAVTRAALEGVSVRDVMTPAPEVHTVTETTTVEKLVERMFRERHTGYPVMQNGQLVGIVTLEDARDVNPAERAALMVGDVMSADVQTIGPDEDAMEALTRFQRDDIGRLPVVEDGELAGIISRTDLMTALSVVREGDLGDPSERVETAGDD